MTIKDTAGHMQWRGRNRSFVILTPWPEE